MERVSIVLVIAPGCPANDACRASLLYTIDEHVRACGWQIAGQWVLGSTPQPPEEMLESDGMFVYTMGHEGPSVKLLEPAEYGSVLTGPDISPLMEHGVHPAVVQ